MLASYLSRVTLQILLTSKIRGIILNPRAFFLSLHSFWLVLYLYLVSHRHFLTSHTTTWHPQSCAPEESWDTSKVESVVRNFSTVSLKLANIWRMKWAHSKCWENIHTYADVFLSLSLIFQQVKIEAEPWKVGSKKILVAKNIVSKEIESDSEFQLFTLKIWSPN